MSWLEYLVASVVGVLGLYVVVRVSTAAYFRSKEDHERMTANGTQQRTRARQSGRA